MNWPERIALVVVCLIGFIALDAILFLTGPIFALIFPAIFLAALFGGLYLMVKFSLAARKKRKQLG